MTEQLFNKRIAIIGLGYVGLPLAVAFGKKFKTVGFDINQQRISELKSGQDHTLEVTPEEFLVSLSWNLVATLNLSANATISL